MEMVEEKPELVNHVDHNLMTALHWAVKRNYITMAEILLNHEADKDAQDYLGRTPLHLAASQDFLEMTKVLLRWKVALSKTNRNG